MQRDEDRIAPIAALVVMFVVSVTIVGLTFWSGDVFGPWTSVSPVAVERPQAHTPALGASPGQRFGPTRNTSRQMGEMVPKPSPIPLGIPGGYPGPTPGGAIGNPGFIPNPFGSPGLESGAVGSAAPVAGRRPPGFRVDLADTPNVLN